HDRDQTRFRLNRFRELIKIDNAIIDRIEPGHVKTFVLFQMLDRMKDCVMLGLFADDVAAATIRLASRETEDGEIARFGSTAGETDFVWLHFQERGDFVARVIHTCPRVAPSAMNA